MGFFSGLFGGDQRKDIARGRAEADAAIDKRYTSGRGVETGYHDRALKFLEPQIGAGDKSAGLLDDYLGVNGRARQKTAYANFENSPGFRSKLDFANAETQENANARGYLLSGGALKELRSTGHRMLQDDYRDTLDRLDRRAGAGNEARMGAANLTSGTGARLAQSYYGQGGMEAQNAINAASATANTRFTIGDLANLIGSAGKAAAGFGGF